MLDALFASNLHVSEKTLRLTWIVRDNSHTSVPLQVVFAVSKRNFSKAVDRNRIKRLLRENLRQHKNELLNKIKIQNKQFAIALTYTGKVMPDYQQINLALYPVLLRFYNQLNDFATK